MSRLGRAGESFWFLPAVLGLLSLVLAEVMIAIDRAIDGADLGVLGMVVNRVGASGSRDILGAVAGSMLAVAATSFSITISVLATTSSTYGPRLVRNFMADRGNQLVLATFGATFLYCLVVLRSIRTIDDDGATFVPDVAVTFAVLLAVVGVGVLVYFIHHIADSVQVSTLVRRVSRELVRTVEAERPHRADRVEAGLLGLDGVVVPAVASGYVLEVETDALMEHATKAGVVVRLLVRPGDHVARGEPLARVCGARTDAAHDRAPDQLPGQVRRRVVLGPARSPHQDLRFAVEQIVELAVRALSPSMNDPYTAENALPELADGFCELVRRPELPTGLCDEAGRVRVVVVPTTTAELVDHIFDQLRTYALSSPMVLHAAVNLASRVRRAAGDPGVHRLLDDHLDALLESYARSEPVERDLAALRTAVAASRAVS